MDTNAKYSALDHGGLEIAERNEGPEVVPGSGAPLERTPSRDQPEPVQPEHYETNKHDHGNYYADADTPAPAYVDGSQPAYMQSATKEAGVEAEEVQRPREARRYCGMRMGVFIGLVIVLMLVVLGAVLGGVLGTLLTRHKSHTPSPQPQTITNGTSLNSSSESTGPLQATSNTGLAAAVSGDGSGRLYTYYQDPDGRIIEDSYANGSWTLEDRSKINDSVVTTEATVGSALAAISYTSGGQTFRQVFFIDSTGLVRTTNASTNSAWGASTAITQDVASDKSSTGLAACVDHNGMDGIRAYYGSLGYGGIQEVGWQFNDTEAGWTEWNFFDESDADSGVACVIYDETESEGGEMFINVYMRNTTTSVVQQNFWDYAENDGWSTGPATWSNLTIPTGSDIAACNDDQQSEYVFYQLSSGLITRGRVDPSGSSFEEFDNVQGGSSGTKLAAAFVEGGALLVFQNSSSSSTMWVSDISRTLVNISNIAIP